MSAEKRLRRSAWLWAAIICAPLWLVSCGDLTGTKGLVEPKLEVTDDSEDAPEDGAEDAGEDGGVPIIFDTDYGFDVDDVGALAVLNALVGSGEADLLAAITSVTDSHALGAMDAVNTFYGHPDVPLGQNADAPDHYRWGKAYPYWRTPAPHFIAELDESFPHDAGADIATAVARYREVLAAQPDGSVTVVVVGFMKNLADLLKSEPDDLSSLSGEELIRAKVKELVVMGGGYPNNEGDFNLTSGPGKDASDARLVIEAWPTEIVFTPGNVCGSIATGQTLSDPEGNPVAHAYEQFFGRPGRGRASWDLCSVLYAVRGLHAPDGARYFGMATDERLTLSESGRNDWVTPGDPRHKRLTRVMPAAEMQDVLNELLTRGPE